jgi:hypothetical protein
MLLILQLESNQPDTMESEMLWILKNLITPTPEDIPGKLLASRLSLQSSALTFSTQSRFSMSAAVTALSQLDFSAT